MQGESNPGEPRSIHPSVAIYGNDTRKIRSILAVDSVVYLMYSNSRERLGDRPDGAQVRSKIHQIRANRAWMMLMVRATLQNAALAIDPGYIPERLSHCIKWQSSGYRGYIWTPLDDLPFSRSSRGNAPRTQLFLTTSHPLSRSRSDAGINCTIVSKNFVCQKRNC